MKHTGMRHVGVLIVIVLGFVTAVAQAFTLQPPRMVLNRSLFLEWDQAASAGFVSYDIHASTQAGFTPSLGNRVLSVSPSDVHYTRLSGLLPQTVYYFRVRLLTTGGTTVSDEVMATTLADGVGEGRIPTIMYHHCQPRGQFPAGFDPGGWISTANFSRDMSYLKTHGVHAVGIVEIYNRIVNGIPLPPNPVFITFDDGFVTYLQHAVPILRANDFQSVNAIVTRKTGGTSDWAVPEWPLMSLMTWAQIKDCQRQGMWMGSHTQTHADFDLEPNKAYEITGSRDDLLGQLKVHPRYFCYPWGMGGREHRPIIDQVGAAGYTLATRTWPPSIATINSDRLWFPRVFANQNDSLRDFLVKLGVDTDKDGIKDYVEMDWGLDPGNADTDGDGLDDGFEAGYDGNVNTYNPYHPTSNPSGRDLSATRADTDLDGVSDGDEILVYGTDPLRADTDGDGLSDGEEVHLGTDPLKPDTDGDGMSDYDEIHVYHTNPLVHDGRRPFIGAAVAVPACLEVEDFDFGGAGLAYSDTTVANEGGAYRPFERVDLVAETSASNGVSLGWTRAGEWLTYSVSVATSGQFRAAVRLAAQGAGGVFHLEIDDVNVTGPITVPDTGGWARWHMVQSPSFALEAGTRIIKLSMDQVGTSGHVGAFDRFCFVAVPPPGPFGGVPWSLPGRVEIENFNEGGAGTAYVDTTPTNEGGQYRVADGVDISADAGAGNSYVVGWTKAGEWLEYTVNVTTAGTYTLETRVAAVGAGGQFRILVDNIDKTGLLAVPNTGAWNAYQVVRKPGVQLTTGVHTVRVVMESTGASSNVGAFDWFQVVAEPPPGPFGGVPWPLPGTVEIEHYDTGGEGVAYHDATAANEGGQYRTDEGVDITRDTGAGNSHVAGWTKAGEWLEYTVNVTTAGTYTLETRVAAVGAGGQFRIRVNGADKTGLLAVPNTGAWNAYQVVRKPGVNFDAGVQTVRVEMVTTGPSGHVGAFDWFRVVAETPVVQTAYPSGTPWLLPGTVEMENFDEGGADVAYSDTTAANDGGQYRLGEGVDITRDTAAGNNHVVGWTVAGEWLEYTVQVGSSGIYTLETRVAGVGAGGQFRICVNGVDQTGILNVPHTGAWNAYQIVQKTGVSLSLGIHTVRVEMVTTGLSGHVGAFDWFRAVRVSPQGKSLSRYAGNSASPRPIDVRTSQEVQHPEAGWLAVDGDTNTVWQGEPGAGGWWLTLGYDPEIALASLTLDWAPGSPTNVQCLYSRDAQTWDELVLPLTNGPLDLHYLWLLFPDSGAQQTPALREIYVE
ncbi:MAG: carbohydrate-binding protein [Kiritimatiellia bacterium]|nr:carbohydrate-binding protein [Kiritimatiellia bacterium]